jgi:DNA-binding transcriptional ArsR family regulator
MTTGKRLYGKVHRQAAILAALGHPHRLAIAYLLSLEPHRAGRLAARVGITPSLLLHHLGILSAVGLVGKKYEGARAVYSFQARPLWLIKQLLGETPVGKKEEA